MTMISVHDPVLEQQLNAALAGMAAEGVKMIYFAFAHGASQYVHELSGTKETTVDRNYYCLLLCTVSYGICIVNKVQNTLGTFGLGLLVVYFNSPLELTSLRSCFHSLRPESLTITKYINC
jgi:hypothetical protein